jgi:myo-inositol-1(or 4)-monophosphatase
MKEGSEMAKNGKQYPDTRYLRMLAFRAGQIMRASFAPGIAREWKEDETPVTAADMAINTLVLESLARTFPHIRVIAEEGSYDAPDAEYTVFCDPLDGTIPFSQGLPISTFCISVVREHTPVAGVIFDPFQNRLWHAERGCGAFLNDRPVRVSGHAGLHRARIGMIWWHGAPYHLHQVCEKLMEAGAKWMNPSSLAILGGLVASGSFDATIYPGRKAWETAAMQVIVEEAGGRVTDIFGGAMRYGPNGEICGHIVSNGVIHDELARTVRACQ